MTEKSLSNMRNNPPLFIGINGEIAGTLDSSYYKGCGERQGIEREVIFQRRNDERDNGS